MPSLAVDRSDPARSIAEGLAGRPICEMAPVRRGGNSRVFRISTESGLLALKIYPSRAEDARDRLGVEIAALDFMHARGIDQVPRLVAADPTRNAALLEWIDGKPVEAAMETDVDAALAFLGRLHAARNHSSARALAPASEACLSAAELERQIQRRCARLIEIGGDKPILADFLADDLLPACHAQTAAARDVYRQVDLAWDADLDAGRRTLSPSDFGFHNALKRPDGRLVFLDFEYFGWDDPVKLTCDMLLHPGMALADGLKLRFLAGARELFGDDSSLASRLHALYPLFGLRWCTILLNEFLPEKWALRKHAGASDAVAAQSRQLAKSRSLLQRLTHDDPIARILHS